MKASEWAKEAFELVAQDETEKMSIVQEIVLRSTDYLRRIVAPFGGQGGVTMSYLCRTATVSLWKTTFVCLWGKTTKWWRAICGEKYDRRQPNRLLVVHTGESFEQARGIQSACGTSGACARTWLMRWNCWRISKKMEMASNRISWRTSVRGAEKVSRTACVNSSGCILSAPLDVGVLRRGTETFKVRKPTVPEGGSDVTVRERPDELTF